MSQVKDKRFFGLPAYLLLAVLAVVLIATYTGSLSKDLIGAFALMLTIGVIFKEIGNRIPIWNPYIGGGTILAFLGSAALAQWNVLPSEYVELINWATDDVNFLNFFIVMLITGSILSLNRDLLLKSLVGYIPTIIGTIIGASVVGVLTGLLFGIDPTTTLTRYMLPIMGGGNGAGAIPLSEIYQNATGESGSEYYAFAIAILTIANIFAIVAGALLNALGDRLPSLTGDKKNLMKNVSETVTVEVDVKVKLKDYGGALLLALTFYSAGRLFSHWLLPDIFGVQIHQFAYMIVLVVLANALDIIPTDVKKATQILQKFFTGNLLLIIMVGVGISTDLGELFAAITLPNVVMALMIVIGAIVGSILTGSIFKFYIIDIAITAGLGMSARGGSGGLAVLGAAERMDLISYAQLSTRLGGGLILVIGSVIFSLLLG